MAVMKSIQVLSESNKSFEDAILNAVKRTSKSVNDIRSANVQNQSVTIEDGKIKKYRVNCMITFEVS